MRRTIPHALLLMLCLSLFGGRLHAAVQLQADSSGKELNGQIMLLEDVGGRLGIADMANPAVQQRFVPAKGRASVGQNPNPWWIKLELQRSADAPKLWWLEIGAVTPLDLQLYSPDGRGGWTLRQSGERVAFATGRDHDYRRVLLQLPELGGTFGGQSKDALPGSTTEALETYLVEVRRAEWVHWGSVLGSLLLFTFNPWWLATAFVLAVSLGNLPFLVILRNNRFRIQRILDTGRRSP